MAILNKQSGLIDQFNNSSRAGTATTSAYGSQQAISDMQRQLEKYPAEQQRHQIPQSDPSMLLSRVRVRAIENGYLVEVSRVEGEITKQFFIKDLDELGGVLVAEIVANRIEK